MSTRPPSTRSLSRSAARLAAVQALYQLEMEATPLAKLLHEFHQHRLGATIEDATYADAEVAFFFTEDGVSRVIFQDDIGDEFLAADIKLELDVVALHLIDGEIGAEVTFDELTRLDGGVEGDGEERHEGMTSD